jgi:hypothetical protein
MFTEFSKQISLVLAVFMTTLFATSDLSTGAAKAKVLVIKKIIASKTGRNTTILLIFLLLSKLINCSGHL